MSATCFWFLLTLFRFKLDREVVFQCRDEGPYRAKVQWTRGNGLPLPPGSRDINGRLEMPNIKVEHSGLYICQALGYPPDAPGAQVTVHLQVDPCKSLITRIYYRYAIVISGY